MIQVTGVPSVAYVDRYICSFFSVILHSLYVLVLLELNFPDRLSRLQHPPPPHIWKPKLAFINYATSVNCLVVTFGFQCEDVHRM